MPQEYKKLRSLKTDQVCQHIVESHVSYCQAERGINNCSELVTYQYKACGHTRSNIKCSVAFSWAEDNDLALPCDHLTNFNSPLCGHILTDKCHVRDLMHDWSPWVDQVKPATTEYVARLDENKQSVIGYSINEKDLNFNLVIPEGMNKTSPSSSVLSAWVMVWPLTLRQE